ncbi:MAG: hypothetical protein J5554_02190 [Paludibacteraceae bacterium]|nr:hypothetical protein [Paludibacteraceae bacterium]
MRSPLSETTWDKQKRDNSSTGNKFQSSTGRKSDWRGQQNYPKTTKQRIESPSKTDTKKKGQEREQASSWQLSQHAWEQNNKDSQYKKNKESRIDSSRKKEEQPKYSQQVSKYNPRQTDTLSRPQNDKRKREIVCQATTPSR